MNGLFLLFILLIATDTSGQILSSSCCVEKSINLVELEKKPIPSILSLHPLLAANHAIIFNE